MGISEARLNMSIRPTDCTFAVKRKIGLTDTTVNNIIASTLYALHTLSSDLTLEAKTPQWVDINCNGAARSVTMPTTSTTGKIITIRNISTTNHLLTVLNFLSTEEYKLYSGNQQSFLFDGTNWVLATDGLTNFAYQGAYDKDAATSAYGDKRPIATGIDSFAIGLDAFCDSEGSSAVGYRAKALARYCQAKGYEGTADRVSERGEMAGIDANRRHRKSVATWSGELIPVATGYHEIFLFKVDQERFYVKNNSIVSGTLTIHGTEISGGTGRYISRIYAVHIWKGATDATLIVNRTILNNVINDAQTILNVNLTANTLTGNFEIWVQSGSAVAQFDTFWTASFDYIETLF